MTEKKKDRSIWVLIIIGIGLIATGLTVLLLHIGIK
jgi:flagellar basal body-associated protein FliL